MQLHVRACYIATHIYMNICILSRAGCYKNVTKTSRAGGAGPSFFCNFRVFLQSIEFDYGRTERARAMKFFLWGCGVIIFDAAKFERRSFCRSGDTARAKLRIYYASNSVLAAKNPFFS